MDKISSSSPWQPVSGKESDGENILILFDIDQTLVNSAGCGRRAMERTFFEFFHVPQAFEGVSLNGKTDPQIIFEVLEKFNLSQALTPKLDYLFWKQYVFHLEEELKNSKEIAVEPGVPALLDRLRSENTLYLGLLTGNIQEGARTKLEHFGLWDYFPVGGFGSDNPDRNVVAQVTLARCSKFYRLNFSMDFVFVVGDSLRDIACAKAIGARCISVATGLDSYTLLESEQPFLLLPDLSNTEKILEIFKPQRKT